MAEIHTPARIKTGAQTIRFKVENPSGNEKVGPTNRFHSLAPNL